MHQKEVLKALMIALDLALAHTPACTGMAKPDSYPASAGLAGARLRRQGQARVAVGPCAHLGTQRKRGRRQHGWHPAERPGLTAGALKWSNIRPLMKGLAAICVLAIPSLVAAEDSAFIEEVVIVGSRTSNSQLAGSAHHIGQEQLKRLGHGDIQRIIRQVPGVSVQVEDGYGLRPNISIRGVATERSGRITLLEDNVLIAPAPYSAPSAYYFPTTGRMAAIEVLTGPAAIKQGPYTIGGALNMLSTPGAGRSRRPSHAGRGRKTRVGACTPTTAHAIRLASAFWRKPISGVRTATRMWDRGGDAGLDLEDYTLKFSYAPPAAVHRVDLKLQHAKQESQQSYLGLTDADFAAAPFRRYGLSALDNIETNHKQLIARYQWTPTEAIDLSAHYYRNSHERDWFKTEGIDFDGSPNAGAFSRTSWANVVQAVNRRQPLGGFTPAQLQGRSGRRAGYGAGQHSSALQRPRIPLPRGAGAVGLALDPPAMPNISSALAPAATRTMKIVCSATAPTAKWAAPLRLDDPGLLGNAGNRLQEAWATSVFIMDEITWGPWTFTPGLRYEDIEQKTHPLGNPAGTDGGPRLPCARQPAQQQKQQDQGVAAGLRRHLQRRPAAFLFRRPSQGLHRPPPTHLG